MHPNEQRVRDLSRVWSCVHVHVHVPEASEPGNSVRDVWFAPSRPTVQCSCVACLAAARTYRTRPPRAHTAYPSRWHPSLLTPTQTVLAAHSRAESPAHQVRDTHLVSGRQVGAHNARSPHPVRCPISKRRQLCSGSGSWCPALPPVHPISDCALRGALSTPSTGWPQRC